MLATMRHLIDLGGRLAPTKSKLFTTVKDFGKWLAAEFWEPVQAQIPVVSHLRDLGSALTVAAARVTNYSYARLATGIQTVAAIRKLPHAKEQKAQFVIRSAHKQNFYGCESSQIDLTMLANYTSEVLRTIGSSNQQRSRSLTFGFSGAPFHIDPYIEIFLRRVTLFRRYLVKYPHKNVLVDRIYTAYDKASYTGVHSNCTDLAQLHTAPLPGKPGREPWDPPFTPHGPIGLFLEHTHHFGATARARCQSNTLSHFAFSAFAANYRFFRL